MFPRDLGGFEQTWVMMDDAAPVLFVGVVHLTNGPSVAALRSALDTLSERHALLRVRIGKEAGRPRFVEQAGDFQIPVTVIERSGGDHWRDLVETELMTPLDTLSAPLCRCTYLTGEGDSEMLLTFHHTIIDSKAGVAWLEELLRLCSGEDNADEDAAAEDALPAMEALFPRRLSGWRGGIAILRYLAGQMAVETAYRIGLRGRQPLHRNARANNRIATSTWSVENTKALVRATRKQRSTLNNLLLAAMLAALAGERYAGQKLPMRALTFADMRPYFQPPLERQMGVYISMLPLTVPISPDTDIWQLARQLGEQTGRAIKRDDKYLAPLISRHLVKLLLATRSMRLGMAALSYAGPLPVSRTYGTISVRNLSGFVANNVLGPELAAFGTIVFGRLNIDLLYLDTDMTEAEAQKVIDAMKRIIRSACDGQGETLP